MLRIGLGAVNPFVKQTANVPLIQQSGGVWSEKAGTFNITQNHWTDIAIEMGFPVTPANEAERVQLAAEADARAATYRDRLRAMAVNLPPCPAESQTEPGVCYYGRVTPAAGDDEIDLIAPFTINQWGVVFGLTELQNGKFQRTIMPTPAQRKQLELAVIRRSHQRLFGSNVSANIRQPIGNALIYDSIRKAAATGSIWTTDRAHMEDPSVDDMMRLVPDIALYLVNFQRNPVQPTPTERTGVGGWKSWLARGGYPLSRAVASARVPILDRFALQTCVSLLCRCGDPQVIKASWGADIVVGGQPSCVPATIDGNGIHDPTSASGEWASFIAFSQDLANPWVQVTLRYEDPSKWDKMTNAIANAAEKFGKALCTTFGANQEQFTAIANTEVCTDVSGKPCVKGSAGCVCKKPSSATQASVGISNAIIGKMCGKLMQEFREDPLQNLPAPVDAPQLPDPVPNTPKIPWWVIALGGLGVGALLASRR